MVCKSYAGAFLWRLSIPKPRHAREGGNQEDKRGAVAARFFLTAQISN